MLKHPIKIIVNSSPSLKATAFVIDDFIKGIRLAMGNLETDSGATHSELSEEKSVSYIEEVFKDYKHYGGIERFQGIAAEIGPGDNAGVALLMRRDGCDRVDLIDRYHSYRNPGQQSRIYETLAQRYKLDDFREKDGWDERTLAGIQWKIGQPAELYFKKCAIEQGKIYDFIVSRAVLEHLYNPLDALHDMVDCLKPGGHMFHVIDFRDHGMFTPKHHELTFLEIPGFIYPLMVYNTGRPNRILLHRYRDALESMKRKGLIDYSILVICLVSYGFLASYQRFEDIDKVKQRQAVDFVEAHRKKFASEFSHVDSTELAISGIFLKVTKK
jgi:SAM-dependent methyltransferase